MARSESERHGEPFIPDAGAVAESLRHLDALAEVPSCESLAAESPIFVMAMVWGSGSTLVQRVLMTDPRALIWGEPYGRMGLLTSLTGAMTAAGEDWPKAKHVRALTSEERVSNFVANTFPPTDALVEAQRAMLRALFADPARKRGYERWGVKEVRWCAPDAVLLRRLFPAARFVVVVRSPYDCFRSSMDMQTRWRYDAEIDNAERFATLWVRMATTWLQAPADLAHLRVRYEDLIAGGYDFDSLARHVALTLAPERAIGVRSGQRGGGKELPRRDLKTIRKIAATTMERFGYQP